MRKNSSGEEEEEGANGFFACYLLTSLSPRHKGHTYIGYTVNPHRRIRQHNGEIGSGAVRTKRKRPWEMVMCIYGFPTNVSALQFEWAWQHPKESLAVRTAAATFKSLGGLANKVKLAFTMLTLSKWQDLDLMVNFFSSKYTKHSAGCPTLPKQMSVQVCSMDDLPCYTGIFTLREEEYEDEDRDDLDTGNLFDETGVINEGLQKAMGENDLNIYKSGEDTAVYRETTIYSTYGDEHEDEHRDDMDNRKKTSEGNIDYGGLEDDFTDRAYDSYNWTENTDTCYFGIEDGAEDDLTRSKDSMYNSIGDTDLFGLAKEDDRVEMDQSNKEILHTKTVCDGKPMTSSPIAGSEEVEVIDLLSPSPSYRVYLKTKRRKVSGGVIDLTNSPIFVEV